MNLVWQQSSLQMACSRGSEYRAITLAVYEQ